MPAPDLTQMRSQATTGTVVVLSLIALLAGSPHLRAVGCPSQVPGLCPTMQSASLSLSVVRGVNRAIRSHLATL